MNSNLKGQIKNLKTYLLIIVKKVGKKLKKNVKCPITDALSAFCV